MAALGAVVAALAAGARPTGIAAADVAWSVALVVGVAVLGLGARPRALLPVVVSVGVVAVALGSATSAAAGAAAGLVVFGGPGAAAAGVWLFAGSLLHLGSGPFAGSTALAVAAVVVALGFTRARDEPRDALAARWRWIAGGSAALVLLVGVPGASVLMARSSAERGTRHLDGAVDLLRRGEVDAARRRVAAATSAFAASRRSATGPLMGTARLLPVVSQHLAATRTAAAAADHVARASARAVVAVSDGGLVGGSTQVDLRAVRAAVPAVGALVDAMGDARARTAAIDERWLLPPVRAALERARVRLDELRPTVETAALALRAVPHLLGESRPTRYFVAVQNPAESRGSGGILGNYAELEATDGALAMSAFGRAEPDLNTAGAGAVLHGFEEFRARYVRGARLAWQNVTASPDFPTVAGVIAELYPQSGGRPVDTVLSVDPTALAALLEVTGPVVVAGFDEPLSAATAERILLRDQYAEFDDKTARVEFLGDVARAVFDQLTTGPLPPLAELATALGPAASGGHIRVWSRHADVQRLVERVGVDGAFPAPRGDLFAFVSQNAGANKIDVFLRRTLRYTVGHDVATGRVSARATVDLVNDAPATGAPPYIIESGVRPPLTEPGENRLYVSVHTPLEVVGAAVDGAPFELERQHELGHQVFSGYVTIPSRSTRRIELRMEGTVRRAPYTLDIYAQPVVNPDELRVDARSGGARVVRSFNLSGEFRVRAGPRSTSRSS